MPFYTDAELFCDVMSDLFRQAMTTPQALHAVRKTSLVLRLETTNPAAVLLVDGKAPAPRFACNPQEQKADLILRMPADVLHRVWLGQTRLRDAFFTGQIQVEGPMLRAFGLADLFRQVEALYPHVLEARGLLPAG